jgi:hypothetical protein
LTLEYQTKVYIVTILVCDIVIIKSHDVAIKIRGLEIAFLMVIH